jgi:hypothetical protein
MKDIFESEVLCLEMMNCTYFVFYTMYICGKSFEKLHHIALCLKWFSMKNLQLGFHDLPIIDKKKNWIFLPWSHQVELTDTENHQSAWLQKTHYDVTDENNKTMMSVLMILTCILTSITWGP